jgi:peptidyl-prolyl cis-trans isomerase SurA
MIRVFLPIITYAFLLFVNPAIAAQSQVVAVVDGVAITNIDVQKRLNLIVQTNQLSQDKQTLEIMRKQILQLLVDEQLIRQEAKKFKIKVDELELQHVLSNIAKQAEVPLADLRKYIISQQIDYDQLEDSLRNQILRDKLHKALIYPTINVLDSEISEMQKNLERQRSNPQKRKQNRAITHVKLAEISILLEDGSDNHVEKLLEQLGKEINSGADFAKLAKDFSQSASADRGGEIGWLSIDQLDSDIARVVSQLKPGQISKPIVMPERVQILKLLDVRSKEVKEDKISIPTKDQLREFIFNRKLDAKIRSHIIRLRKKGGVVIN